LNHIQRAGKVCLELVPDVEFVLVFAGADDAVPGAVCDYVDAAEAGYCLVDYSFDGFAGAYVAEKAEAIFVFVFELFHAFGAIFVGAAYGGDEVVAGEGIFDEGAPHVARCSEDLNTLKDRVSY
jgi:hypothetical protein